MSSHAIDHLIDKSPEALKTPPSSSINSGKGNGGSPAAVSLVVNIKTQGCNGSCYNQNERILGEGQTVDIKTWLGVITFLCWRTWKVLPLFLMTAS